MRLNPSTQQGRASLAERGHDLYETPPEATRDNDVLLKIPFGRKATTLHMGARRRTWGHIERPA